MRCPKDGSTLVKRGMSLFCKHCSYKIVDPSKRVYPELHIAKNFPVQYAWDDFTLTNVTVSSDVASISAGQTEGILISPALVNLTKQTELKPDVNKVIVDSITASVNNGKIKLHTSNDGGTTWLRIKDNHQEWRLNYGNESAGGGRQQSAYDDLRIKITLTRSSVSDTSPTISLLNILHNKIPDDKNLIYRDNLDNLITGS